MTTSTESKNTLIPVWREENQRCFADITKVPLTTVTSDGVEYRTTALKPGVKIPLLAIRAEDGDAVCSLDPAIGVSFIYLEICGNIWKFDVKNHFGSLFAMLNPSLEMVDYSKRDLSAKWTHNEKIVTATGTTLTLGFTVEASGVVDLETSVVVVYFKTPALIGVRDDNGNAYDNDEFNNEMALRFAASEIVGYDLHFAKFDYSAAPENNAPQPE